MSPPPARAAGTGSSIVVERCQVCDAGDLQSVIFLGYLPPVNQLRPIGQRPHEQPAYPAEMLYCSRCHLVQLGLIVDPEILFPPSYPYTSGTTRILRENFAELYRECRDMELLTPSSLVVDIGSNDGTLLANFHEAGLPVRGIEPSQVGKLAEQRGIPTTIDFFGPRSVDWVLSGAGPAKIVTATNVFAHIEGIHDVVEQVLRLLDDHGVFVTESHYLFSLLETLQYDTIYHEHLRHYSLHSLSYLLARHGLEVIHARRIPTHGGSIRVYAARRGTRPIAATVGEMLAKEAADGLGMDRLRTFASAVVASKLDLMALMSHVRGSGARVYGIGAPSRASTLINYIGLDDRIVDCVLEVKGSLKVGNFIPGTVIPIVEETRLFDDQPEYALLLSWHIADELIPKLTERGFRGSYVIPLPTPRIVRP